MTHDRIAVLEKDRALLDALLDRTIRERDEARKRIAELERECDEALNRIKAGARIAHALTLETQTPEEWTTDLVRQVREARQQLCQHLVTAERLAALETFGSKVNAIRNSIVGAQALNWSEHVYPLVAALDAAGFVGLPYPEARADVGTLLERLATAEAELAKLKERRFPVIGYRKDFSVPWSVVEAFEHQAEANHGKSLAEIAARGGLWPRELWHVINQRRWAGPGVPHPDCPSEADCHAWALGLAKGETP